MPRFHLVELHEQRWFPRSIRDAFTELLTGIADATRVYDVIWARLAAALERTGAVRIVDLCSGSGGPLTGLLARHGSWSTERPTEVVFTDLHPSERGPGGGAEGTRYEPLPVDAQHVPARLDGFRTIFSAFHHFRPEAARSILQDAVARGVGIGVFEMTERTTLASLAMLTSPFIGLVGLLRNGSRPWPWSRWLWVVLLPMAPLLVVIDGFVSCLRTYTPRELEALVAGVEGAEGYEWEIGAVRAGVSPIRTTYLIGVPKVAAHGERDADGQEGPGQGGDDQHGLVTTGQLGSV